MLYYNNTKLTQIIYPISNAIPSEIRPMGIVDLSHFHRYSINDFKEFTIDKIKNAELVTLNRTYALGDLIQLVPIIRMMKKQLNIKQINVITSPRFIRELNYLYNDIRFYPKEYLSSQTGAMEFGYLFDLNGLLEKDHSNTNDENQLHRLEIYANLFGLSIKDIEHLDWSIKNEGVMKRLIDLKHDKKVIGLQIRGSGKMKTLPINLVKQIATELAKTHYVVLIDNDKDKGFEGKNIINTCGKLSVPLVIRMLEEVDLCITMDSGVLWMCHSANCPVLTFLGSTRESERISLHPQYPQKAKSIDLSKYVGCRPCFETMIRCKGKINCMNAINYDMIQNELMEKINLIIGE